MKRRGYLQSFVVGASLGGGCLAQPNPANLQKNSKQNETITIEASSSDRITAVDNVHMEISVVEPEINQDHTATLEVTLRNEADYERRFNGGASFPFSPGPSTPNGIVLLGRDIERGTTREDCWTARDPDVWQTNESTSFLGSGESSAIQLTVWDDPRTGGCLHSGEYSFEETYSIGDPTADPTVFDWGFELHVSE